VNQLENRKSENATNVRAARRSSSSLPLPLPRSAALCPLPSTPVRAAALVGDDGRCGVATCAPWRPAKKSQIAGGVSDGRGGSTAGEEGRGVREGRRAGKAGKRDTRSHSSSVLWRRAFYEAEGSGKTPGEKGLGRKRAARDGTSYTLSPSRWSIFLAGGLPVSFGNADNDGTFEARTRESLRSPIGATSS